MLEKQPAGVAEMVVTLDLGSSGLRHWGMESRPHQFLTLNLLGVTLRVLIDMQIQKHCHKASITNSVLQSHTHIYNNTQKAGFKVSFLRFKYQASGQ